MRNAPRIAIVTALVAFIWQFAAGSTENLEVSWATDELSIHTVSRFHERLVRYCEQNHCSVSYHGPLGTSKSQKGSGLERDTLAIQWSISTNDKTLQTHSELDHLWIELQSNPDKPRPSLLHCQIDSQTVFLEVLAVSKDFSVADPDKVLVDRKSVRQFLAEFAIYVRQEAVREKREREFWENVIAVER
jgi:hypothetical protein